MATANLFAQYLQPVKSVADYSADLDRRDAVRLQLEGQRRQNALADMAANQQIADRNALQRVAASWSGATTPEERIASLRNAGNSTLMGQADALEKGLIERRKAEAAAGRDKAETLEKQLKSLKFLAGGVMANPSPEYASAALDMWERVTGLSAAEDRKLIASMQDPEQIRQWAASRSMDADKLLPQIQTRNTGGTTDTLAINPITGKPTVTSSIRNTQSPDNAATVEASLANAAATRDAAKLQADASRDSARIRRDQDTEMKLADDYRTQSKSFKEAKDAYSQLSATLGSATTSPAATLAAATKFMKVLDPGSVVRESELGMALQASGVLDRALNYVSTLQSGKKLTPTQAADFKKTSQQIYEAAQSVQRDIDRDYQGKAKAYGLRPEMVTQDLGQNAKFMRWGDLK